MRLDLLLPQYTPSADTAPFVPGPSPLASTTEKTEFDQLLETLYDAAILTDYAGNLIMANRRALDFFQSDLDTMLRLGIDKLISGANQDILQTVHANIEVGRFTLMQAYCVRSDQSTFPAEISVTSVVRNALQCLCFSIRDITVRREVEERLRLEGEAIRNAGDGIVITDTEGLITYANPAVGHLWNLNEQEDLIGQTVLILFPESQGIEDAVNVAVQEGSWNGELEGAKPDLQSLYLQANITASVDENERITHLVFSFADITRRRQGEMALIEYQNHLEDLIRERTVDLESTNRELRREVEERREIEEKLREAIHQLREHNKAKSIFVSNVSHELRTPLTSLINSLENLMRGIVGTVTPAFTSYFNMMLEDCWRLERTINDILDLSRIEKGTFKLIRHPIPLVPLLRRTAEAIRLSAESIPLQYAVSPGSFPGFVDGDAAKIERVLTNIVSNAVKFTPPHGSCTVAFQQTERNGKPALACEVTDSGIGIPSELIGRVTERFFRIGEQVEGTGLGLAIAREIMEKHGGGIEIASPPPGQDQGTLVRMWLPKIVPPRIIVVLPETEQANDLCAELRQREYQVTLTSRGTDAVQSLRDDHFGLALIGANLPDISGTETIMHIMADAALRRVKLFYLTENPLDQTKTGLLQGFDIPHLMLGENIHLLIDQMEDTFLPISRTRTENPIASLQAAIQTQGGSTWQTIRLSYLSTMIDT